jgi:hypothetical protein
MKHTRLNSLVLGTILLAAVQCAVAAESKPGESWQSLFDGTTLKGWQLMHDTTAQVTNGVIRVGGGLGWLRSEETFADFILEAECRGLETNYNSGFFVRAGLEGKPFPDGVWQVNLKSSAVGALLKGSTVILDPKLPTPPVGQWCKFRIEARGQTLTLFINDAKAWKFDELPAGAGSVGLQGEGKLMEFRNIRVQRLAQSGAATR